MEIALRPTSRATDDSGSATGSKQTTRRCAPGRFRPVSARSRASEFRKSRSRADARSKRRCPRASRIRLEVWRTVPRQPICTAVVQQDSLLLRGQLAPSVHRTIWIQRHRQVPVETKRLKEFPHSQDARSNTTPRQPRRSRPALEFAIDRAIPPHPFFLPRFFNRCRACSASFRVSESIHSSSASHRRSSASSGSFLRVIRSPVLTRAAAIEAR